MLRIQESEAKRQTYIGILLEVLNSRMREFGGLPVLAIDGHLEKEAVRARSAQEPRISKPIEPLLTVKVHGVSSRAFPSSLSKIRPERRNDKL